MKRWQEKLDLIQKQRAQSSTAGASGREQLPNSDAGSGCHSTSYAFAVTANPSYPKPRIIPTANLKSCLTNKASLNSTGDAPAHSGVVRILNAGCACTKMTGRDTSTNVSTHTKTILYNLTTKQLEYHAPNGLPPHFAYSILGFEYCGVFSCVECLSISRIEYKV